jgi:hypothetical protein
MGNFFWAILDDLLLWPMILLSCDLFEDIFLEKFLYVVVKLWLNFLIIWSPFDRVLDFLFPSSRLFSGLFFLVLVKGPCDA